MDNLTEEDKKEFRYLGLCKYGCGTEVLWNFKTYKVIEAMSRGHHTAKKCQRKKEIDAKDASPYTYETYKDRFGTNTRRR
jgi:hypothetical protein